MGEGSSAAYHKVAVLESIIEAQLVTSILREQHIPHRVRSYHDTAYDGLFQMQKGWGEIWAPADRRREILTILDAVRSENPNS